MGLLRLVSQYVALVVLWSSCCCFGVSGFQSLVTPYTTAPPTFVTTGVVHPVTPRNYGSYSRPYKTNGWWATLGIDDGSAQFTPLPYSIAATFGGLEICSPSSIQTTKGAVNSDCSTNTLLLGAVEKLGKQTIEQYDDYLTVTVQYSALTNPECPGFSYFNGGYDLQGRDLFQIQGTAEDCCGPCAKNSSCEGFTWYNGACYMKTAITGSVLSFGRVSSVKSTRQFQFLQASGSVSFPIAHGMPYITGLYSNLSPYLMTVSQISSVNGQAVPAIITSDTFHIKFSGGLSWALFSSAPLTLNCSFNIISSSSPFSGWFRAAHVFDGTDQSFAVLNQYKTAIPISGSVDYGMTGASSAAIVFQWKVQGTGPLLMMALPHHLDILQNPQLTNLKTVISKGTMTGTVGNSWTLLENNLPSITWTCPHGIIDCNKKDTIFQALAEWQFYDPGPFAGHDGSIYWYDKGIWKLARLAVIAEEFGADDIAQTMRDTLQSHLEPLLLGQVENPWVYEPTWGGILPNDSLSSFWVDYGSGWYNDHHFHLGYMLYCIAVVSKGNPQWGSTMKPHVIDLLRDITNPVKDNYFPATRHLDFFVSHSWAGGVFSGSRNQESTSEAVNAYFATYLYGLTVGDSHIENVGRILLATEIRGAQTYWHIKSSGTVYKSPFSDNKVVGILWEDGANYGTFFSADPQDIHLIQMLPFSPISEVLLPEDWVAEQFPVLERTRTAGWEDLVTANQAIIDPVGAWKNAFNVSFGAGTTLPHTLYWIATRPSNGPGQICTKTYPPIPCSGTCCPNLIQIASAGLSDGNYAYFKKDYRIIFPSPSRGFNVIAIDGGTHKTLHNVTFDTYGDPQASANFLAFVQGLPTGVVVLVGVQDTVAAPVSSEVESAINLLGGKMGSLITFRGSYGLLGSKGGPALAENAYASGRGPLTLTYQFQC